MPQDSSFRLGYPKSFVRLLLTGLLIIGVLLVGAFVKTVLSLETFAQQSQRATYQAVKLTQALQSLDEQATAMERGVRQYLLLEDSSFFQTYVFAERDSVETLRYLRSLALAAPIKARLEKWEDERRAISQILAGTQKGGDREQSELFAHFSTLASLNRQLLAESHQSIDRDLQAMRKDISVQKRELAVQIAVIMGVTVILTLTLGYLISRPLRQLDRAINQLGANQLDQPIHIEGPSDLFQLGQRLEWLRQRWADLEAEKSRFLRHMSHELKTPLAAVREAAELLNDEIAGTLAPGQKPVVRILRQNSLTLQRQIEDLLSYNAARFSTSKLVEQECRLDQLLNEVVREHALGLQSRDVQLDADVDPVAFFGDAEKLKTVFDNLISNAIKFSPKRSRIRLLLKHDGPAVRFECRDEGPGVSEQDVQRVFEPFYQGQRQPESHVQGSGLGLSIAKEYVELHGGSIELLPQTDGGAHFLVRFTERLKA